MHARVRRCAYCDAPLGSDLGPAARYCTRSHRQRAYEARQAEVIPQLQLRIRNLRRLIASYERILDTVAERGEDYAAAVTDALQQETLSAMAEKRAARGGAGPKKPSS